MHLSTILFLPFLLVGCLFEDKDPVSNRCLGEGASIRLGGSWVSGTSGTHDLIKEVVWMDGRFVAVGEFDSTLVSSDGVNWEVNAVPARLNALAWSGNPCTSSPLLLTVGVGDGGVILTTTDGVTWVERASGISHSLRDVVWTGSRFVVVGDSGTILTSENGATWVSQTSETTVDLRGVAANDSVFVAVGDGILTSPDGLGWTMRAGDNADATGLHWVSAVAPSMGGGFLAFNPGAHPESSYYTLTSGNGEGWVRGGLTASGRATLIGNQNVTLSGPWEEATIRLYPPPDGDTTWMQALGVQFQPSDAAWNGSRLVVVGSGGTIMTLP